MDNRGQRRDPTDAVAQTESRLLLDASPDIIAQFDREGRCRFISAALGQLLGTMPAELAAGDLFELVHPDDRPAVHATFAELTAQGGPRSLRMRCRHSDGQYLWFETRASLVLDDTGQPAGFLAVAREISAQVETERQLQQSERRFQDLTDHLDVVVWQADLAGRLTYVNQRCQSLLGRSPDSYLGQPVESLWTATTGHTDGPARRHELLASAETAPQRTIGEAPRPDAEPVPVAASWRLVLSPEGAPLLFQGALRDLTEQRQVQAALRDSHATLSSVFRVVPVGIGILTNRVFEYANDRLLEMLGYEASELIGQPARVIYPDDQEYEFVGREKYRQIRETGSGMVETRWLRRDGEVITVLLASTPVNPSDLTQPVIATALDISDRKTAEAKLRSHAELLATLLDTIPSPIFYKNAEGRYLGCNRLFAERIVGLPSEEIIGRTVADLPMRIPMAQALQFQAQDTGLLREPGVQVYESPVTCADGVTRPFLFHKATFVDATGQTAGLVGVMIDITEIQERSREVRELSQRLQAVIEASPLALLALDNEGRVTMWNRAAEKLFGWTAAEVVGQPYPVVPADLRARFDDYLSRTAEGWSYTDLETVRRHKDGRLIPVTVSTAPVLDPDGEVVGSVAMIADITARQEAEAERQQLAEQLRQASKMEAIGRLAGGVAHDFNNLLTAISGYGAFLLDEIPADSPWREDVEEINAAAGRAAELTRQLLAFSRKQVIEPRLIRLEEVVEGLEPLLRRMLGEDVILFMDCAADCQPVLADAGQIEQVLMNLAANSKAAMPHGGEIRVQVQPARLTGAEAARAGAAPGQYMRLRFTDTGVGMEAATLEHIFEPFFTTKPVGQGTGLGLATVYGIIRQSDGYIICDSDPGAGTTFSIYLSLADPAVDRAHEAQAAVSPVVDPHGDETILLVEDEEAVRKLTRRILESYGYQVWEAADADEAMRLIANDTDRIDLLLSDVVMPHLSGPDLADRLRQIQPGLRVLFISGYNEEVVSQRGVLQEGLPLLRKPFLPGQLVRRVRELLDGPPPRD